MIKLNGQVYLNYRALKEGLYYLNKEFKEEGIKTVALPKIGCGLAGGDWEKVSKIIKTTLKDVKVKVYYL